MTLCGPESLGSKHQLNTFNCGKLPLNEWLIRYAHQAQTSGSAKTFVIADHDEQVVGYFSLTVGQIDTLDAPDRIRKGMGHYPICRNNNTYCY